MSCLLTYTTHCVLSPDESAYCPYSPIVQTHLSRNRYARRARRVGNGVVIKRGSLSFPEGCSLYSKPRSMAPPHTHLQRSKGSVNLQSSSIIHLRTEQIVRVSPVHWTWVSIWLSFLSWLVLVQHYRHSLQTPYSLIAQIVPLNIFGDV